MEELGFVNLDSDAGLFMCLDEASQTFVVAVIYVDDAIFLGPKKPAVDTMCHDFRRFPTFLCLSPKRPHSFTQPMTCFPFPFPHDLYLIFYPTFYLIFLFGHFGYQGQVRSVRFTWRLVSLGLPKEFYLLGSHRPFKPHCVHVGDHPLDLLRRGHLRGIQDLGQ